MVRPLEDGAHSTRARIPSHAHGRHADLDPFTSCVSSTARPRRRGLLRPCLHCPQPQILGYEDDASIALEAKRSRYPMAPRGVEHHPRCAVCASPPRAATAVHRCTPRATIATCHAYRLGPSLGTRRRGVRSLRAGAVSRSRLATPQGSFGLHRSPGPPAPPSTPVGLPAHRWRGITTSSALPGLCDATAHITVARGGIASTLRGPRVIVDVRAGVGTPLEWSRRRSSRNTREMRVRRSVTASLTP